MRQALRAHKDSYTTAPPETYSNSDLTRPTEFSAVEGTSTETNKGTVIDNKHNSHFSYASQNFSLQLPPSNSEDSFFTFQITYKIGIYFIPKTTTPLLYVVYFYTGVLISHQPDQEGNKLQGQKILSFIYPTYNHNWRKISTVYIYNKTSIKRNILTIKQNTQGNRSG